VREVIARIVDGSEFDEFKALYGTTLVTGFAHIWGCRSASSPTTASCSPSRAQGRAFHRAVRAARHSAAVPAEHHRLHGRRQIRGRRHRQGRRQAGDRGGLTRAVPKLTVLIGGSFGAGNYGMCGRAYGRASCGCGRTRASA
jgi:3-methylcrotonyl-CoA carboxylase beta subunit